MVHWIAQLRRSGCHKLLGSGPREPGILRLQLRQRHRRRARAVGGYAGVTQRGILQSTRHVVWIVPQWESVSTFVVRRQWPALTRQSARGVYLWDTSPFLSARVLYESSLATIPPRGKEGPLNV